MKNKRITIVCGMARSGCTPMMRMLEAGGYPLFPCSEISYQPEVTRASADDLSWLGKAAGSAVKLLEPQTLTFPANLLYDFIYMVRDPHEQAKSQVKFLEAMAPTRMRMGAVAEIADNIQRYRRRLGDLLASYRGARMVPMRFEPMLRNPIGTANMLKEFLEHDDSDFGGFDAGAAAAVIVSRSPNCFPGLLEEQLIAGTEFDSKESRKAGNGEVFREGDPDAWKEGK